MWKKIKKINSKVLVNIILNLITIMVGMTLMTFPAFGLIDPIYYISLVFYILSFFTVISYFLERKDNDYELLFLSLINILVATFMFVFQNKSTAFIFGTALLLYTLLNLLNKGYHIYKYKEEKNYLWAFKLLSMILLSIIGLLTISNLYREISVITMIFGYYFITFGFINLIEPLFELSIESGYLKKLVNEVTKDKSKNKKN